MYWDDPAVLPPDPAYCEVPTKLGDELVLYCESCWGSSIVGGCCCGCCCCGPERAARDADREPEPSLPARLDCRRWPCNCAAYSGPKYCDSRTVFRFSYLYAH